VLSADEVEPVLEQIRFAFLFIPLERHLAHIQL
jgi:hypothetical protein